MTLSVSELSAQLDDLQSKLAFQEDSVQTLDRIVVEQQQRLDHLEAVVTQLQSQLMEALAWAQRQQPGDEPPPPHY